MAASMPASTYSILSPWRQAISSASSTPIPSHRATWPHDAGPMTAVPAWCAGGSASSKPASSAGEYSRVLSTVQVIAASSTTAPK
ncbi:hypothetical protein G6F59_017772 [Rhizopus arrhizus]|nr:hypothetical protein G6F24_016812 [Rhizopus arrhizus]KAG0910166.1 hypothetical protein G6F32_016839 [Rhizopus arrhizus]KAG1383784.1 hypothetical protein G6F59_017772 [Rhizopus arrhizus]